MLHFKEWLKDDFGNKLDSLCEALSGVDLEEFWTKAGFACLSKASDEKELLEHLLNEASNWQPYQGSPAKVTSPFVPTRGYQGNPNWADRMRGMPQVDKEKKFKNFQNRLGSEVESIKNRFSQFLNNFVNNEIQNSYKQNSSFKWKVAKTFADQVKKAVDNFTMHAKFREPSYVQDYQYNRTWKDTNMGSNNTLGRVNLPGYESLARSRA